MNPKAGTDEILFSFQEVTSSQTQAEPSRWGVKLPVCGGWVLTLILMHQVSSFPTLAHAADLEITVKITPTPSSAPTPLRPSSHVEFDRVENNTIFFKGEPATSPPPPKKTQISDLCYIGVLRPSSGSPYFLFSGKSCSNCPQDRGIFSVRPNGDKPVQFTYPGKIVDPKKGAVVSESRAFFGKCLNSGNDGLFKFQRDLIERKRRRARIQESVLIAEVAEDHFQETLLERHRPQITTALKYVRSKICHEIEGKNRQVSRLQINIHPDDSADDDDDENDDRSEPTLVPASPP